MCCCYSRIYFRKNPSALSIDAMKKVFFGIALAALAAYRERRNDQL